MNKKSQLQEELLPSANGSARNDSRNRGISNRGSSINESKGGSKDDLALEKEIKSIQKNDGQASFLDGEAPVIKNDPNALIIDFDSRFKEHTARTEKVIPYTLTQVEDAMYLDQHTVATLEFHYYQRNCKYTMLNQHEEFEDEEGKWVDANGDEINHQLGTNNYQDVNLHKHACETAGVLKDDHKSHFNAEHIHPMSAFDRDNIRNYYDSKIDLTSHRNTLKDPRFIHILGHSKENDSLRRSVLQNKISMSEKQVGNYETKEDYAQAVVATYKVNQHGGMRRFNEAQVLMGRNFSGCSNGNMTLTRSRDKSVISLLNFDRSNKQGRFFKLLAWTVKLRPLAVSEALNEALSRYFQNNLTYFHELVEVCFVAKQKYVMMTYIERIKRIEQERVEYKLEIDEMKKTKTQFKRKLNNLKFSQQINEKIEFRRAKKYVFFDAETGEIVLTYGGVQSTDFFMKGRSDQKCQIYLLDMVIKEIREEEFDSKLLCFFAGDFLSKEEVEESVMMKWGMGYAAIAINDLVKLKHDPKAQRARIMNQIQQVILERRFEQQNHYQFHEQWIIFQPFNWETNFDITCSRRCDQFAIIYSPQEGKYPCQKVLYVNGPKFKQVAQFDEPDQSFDQTAQSILEVDMNIPFYQRLQRETTYKHVRNSLLKDQLFYSATRNGRTEIFCVRLDHEDPTQKQKSTRIIIRDNLIDPDVFMFFERDLKLNNSIDIFQTIHVCKGDQKAILKTRRSGDQGIVERTSDKFCQQRGDFPCIAYNLGDSKIVIQNILQESSDYQQFILDLEPEERFVCFVDFNDYMDIGFFPNDLQIELCSRFLFLTTGRNPCGNQIVDNQLNLLFVDPYYFEIQVALFKSSSLFDNTIIKFNDFIVKACAQSTKGKKKDKSYKTSIWAQFPDRLLKSRIVTDEMLDDDGQLDEDQCSNQEDQEGESEEETMPKPEFDCVPMLQDMKEFIYYVVKQNGQCIIMEANPRDQKIQNHYPIFSITCPGCYGFEVKDQDTFFFATNDSTVLMLKRCDMNRELIVNKELKVKEMNRMYFKPSPFEQVIMREMYAIKGDKIIYLQDQQSPSCPDGIFEAEDILGYDRKGQTQSPSLIFGPTKIRGSTLLFDVFMQKKTESFKKILILPDSTEQTLINDNQASVDLSSFLDDGRMLVRIGNRFMVFEKDGKFIDEVEFNNDAQADIDRDYKMPQRRMTLSRFRKQSSSLAGGRKKGPKRRKRDYPILDFNGYFYEVESRRKEGNQKLVYDKDKMELLQISQNNKFYLFFNKEIQRIFVYELCEVGMIAKDQEEIKNMQKLYEQIKKEMRREFEFVMRYEIKYDDTELFQFLYKVDVDPLDYFVNRGGIIKMDWKGNVIMCYVDIADKDTLNETQIYDECCGEQDGHQDKILNAKILGAIFKKGQKKQCQIFNFNDSFDFPKSAHENFSRIQMQKIKDLEMKLEKIRQKYSRLPKKLYDYQEYENIIEELLELEDNMDRPANISAKYFFDNLLIVYYGQFIKFGFFDIEKEGTGFQDINIKLSSDVEIIKLIETSTINRIQIVAKDHRLKILKIISWDFNENAEFGMMQIQCEEHGINHLIKGINQKSNYFLTPLYLSDLEHNIPIRQSNLDQNLILGQSYQQQIQKLDAFVNQRKLCPQNQSFLGIEKPGCIYHSLSRLDIVYWLSVQRAGMSEKLISQTCTLDMFNLTIRGKSLFHYFAHIPPIIESIQAKLEFARINGYLTPKQANLPLQILNPDREAKTALFHAINTQSPKSFELMMALLHGFDDYAITKMMLDELPQIIKSHSVEVINFFGQAVFKPQQMKVLQFIPWNENIEEIIFPSHTSYVYRDLLIKNLVEKGIQDVKQVDPNKKRRAHIVDLNKKRSQVLDAEKAHHDGCFDADEDVQLKKVAIEAMDCDWIFYQENAKELLHLLANDADSRFLTQKVIRVFIHLIWSHYQWAIIKFIFGPYVIYLSLLSYLGGHQIGTYCNRFYRDTTDEDANHEFFQAKIVTYAMLCICSCMWIAFASLEAGQMVESGIEYFSDYWNCIDAISMTLNFSFLWMSTINCLLEKEYFAISKLHCFGGYVAFFMWIKVFYWMRLFTSLAYYVKLIQQTIGDVGYFMLMVAIILMSFASFFYIVNRNFLNVDSDDAYYESYTGFGPIDVIISMYCVGALGDFDTTLYEVGIDRQNVMIMFLLSTFLISVVFMNMLIAIMGQTFSDVTSTCEESGLSQQVVLISDHIWLVDLKQVFHDQKYIIRIAPAQHEESSQDIFMSRISALENTLSKNLEQTHSKTIKSINAVDVVNRNQFQQQQKVNYKVQKQLKYFETIFAEQFLMGKQNIENKKLKKEMQIENKKKSTLVRELSNQLEGHTIKREDVERIATEWLEIADKDGNGQLDFEEFEDFFSRLEGVYVSDQLIREIFNSYDTSGDNQLSLEEFCEAIETAVLNEMRAYGDEDDEACIMNKS